MKALSPLDYGRPTPPPRELVPGLVRYGALTLLTGREGSGKSWLATALAASVARGEPWLGLPTERARTLVIDQENPSHDALERLYGLGLRPDDQTMLRVLSQQGVMLMERESAAAIEREIQSFEPQLLVLDGAVSVGGVDPVDNRQVMNLLGLLRRWANRYDLALVGLHHIPKAAPPDDPDAALGAGAWRTQVDAHIHAATVKPHHEENQAEDGGLHTLYRYRLSTSSKVRWGPRDVRQRFVVKSERAPDGAVRWARVEAEGDVEYGRSRPSTDDRIITALESAGRILTTEEVAEAVGLKVTGSLRGRLARLAREGRIKRHEGGWEAA